MTCCSLGALLIGLLFVMAPVFIPRDDVILEIVIFITILFQTIGADVPAVALVLFSVLLASALFPYGEHKECKFQFPLYPLPTVNISLWCILNVAHRALLRQEQNFLGCFEARLWDE